MEITSPSTCILKGDIVKMECRKAHKNPDKPDKIQNRLYYIAQKAEGNFGEVAYLALRLTDEKGRLELFEVENSEDGPMPVLLTHAQKGGGECRNVIVGKERSPRYCSDFFERVASAIRTDSTAKAFLRATRSDQGPVICGTNYDNFQEAACEARRRHEFYESVGYMPGSRVQDRGGNVTLGDACGEQLAATQSSSEIGKFEA